MKFKYTTHAIERYVKRYASHLSFDEAKQYLVEQEDNAVRLKAQTVLGQEQWKLGPTLIVTKYDKGNPIPVVVTVLPAHCGDPRNSVPEEELAMALELIEERGYADARQFSQKIALEDDAKIEQKLPSKMVLKQALDIAVAALGDLAGESKEAMEAIRAIEARPILAWTLKKEQKLPSKKMLKEALDGAVEALHSLACEDSEKAAEAIQSIRKVDRDLA